MSILDVFALLGGVGLFLYGMMQMSSGLKNAAGDNLRIILEKATRNRVVSVLVGILVTMMIQSSSATDVMVIGFVNSGLMNLSQALGVIMGANIGTTVTAQLTAFDLGSYAPMILFVGTVMYLFMKKATIQYIGQVIMGFGMLFEGITLMKQAIIPMSQTEQFIALLEGLSNPAAALIFGILFTALVQSSSSSIAIFQAFAIQGILDYYTVVYLAIGAAIGLGAGLASGYVGVGGGFIMVPLMMSILHVPMKLTSGTSLIAVMILAIPGTITQAVLGNINWVAGIAVACGSIPGATLGAKLIPKVPERQLRFLFAGFLVVAAVLLVVNQLGVWG